MKTLLDLKFAYLFLTKELSQFQINFKNSYQSSPAQIVFAVKLSRPGLSPISAQLVFFGHPLQLDYFNYKSAIFQSFDLKIRNPPPSF